MKWVLHGLALAVLFGVPYARGRWRAQSLHVSYVKAAACMYGGTPSQSNAIGPVEDAAGYYAAMFLQRRDHWPARCEGALNDLANEPARFLLPSVKEAEANVQKAAQIVLTEIHALPAEVTPGAKVPLRPLWALEMLRSAVEADAEAAGATSSTLTAPISFSHRQTKLPTPSLFNIDSAPDAAVKVWGKEVELQVAAFDARAVSYIRLTPTEMTRARLPRTNGLRSVVIEDDSAYLVWTTPLEKCGATHCAGKSTGIAPMPIPLTKIPAPTWVAAHPFGTPARSLAWQGRRMWMAAAKLDGTAKLVEFTYTQAAEASSPPQTPELEPHGPIDDARELVVFADSAGELGALALVVGARGHLEVVMYRDSGAKTLVSLPPDWTSGWLRMCSATNAEGGDSHYFVVGRAGDALIGYVRDAATITWPMLGVHVPAPQRSENHREQGAALACTGGSGITVAFTEDDGTLATLTCARGATDCATHRLAELADAVDATYTTHGALIAYSGGATEPQVRLRALDPHGVPSADPFVPAPCWERWGGLCGPPKFAWVGGKLVLAARSGPNLMAVESADAGESWSELSSTKLIKPPGPQNLPR